MGKNGKKKEKGGAGKTLMLLGVVVVGGIAAAWFVAPDFVREQLHALRGLIGV